METRKSSSPDTVLGPEDSKKFSDAKNRLFITLYRRRRTYFNRWKKVTENYFQALEQGDRKSVAKQTESIDEVIEKYAEKIRKRTTAFADKFQHAVSDDGKALPFLNGMDVLVWPEDRDHRKALIEKENEYHDLNQTINPDTKIPQSDTESVSSMEQ